MKTFFYCSPKDSLKHEVSSLSLSSSDLSKVVDFAKNHVTDSLAFDIYLIIKDIDATGDITYIFKKLFEIHEKFILPIVINDFDSLRMPCKS